MLPFDRRSEDEVTRADYSSLIVLRFASSQVETALPRRISVLSENILLRSVILSDNRAVVKCLSRRIVRFFKRGIMRVKTVPRHLPRVRKFEDNNFVCLKSVNSSSYKDMIQEMNLVIREQSIIPQSSFEQWQPFSTDVKVEAVDLSVKNGSSVAPAPVVEEHKFKDTYLYQIMTDPNFLKKINCEKQPSKSSCPYCKKEFASESEMKSHLNVQPDESKQLVCCACGKSFAQKRYLRYHQRSHSERNKYACRICTRKYSRHDNLTRHNIFHTNPDKFPCNSCERTFARKDLLNKHLKCHENKYKFHCDLCQKYFKGPITLENHMKLFHSSTGEASGESFSSLRACMSNGDEKH
ncbi:zinc finger protein 525-like [Nasonia vitripennis]|uniref:C2H2-type domain-containing protein n=1 Tax=Nasonia vitripennis TaxID=7425 RepID=A0A7M7GCZ4_NASVI|nr:zinc finger protein 525-like [Nasonia vitripennis]